MTKLPPKAAQLPVVRSAGHVPVRHSVSALREYRKCPRYYRFKRIDKLPDTKTHHAAAARLVQSAYYMAYGFPSLAADAETGHLALTWNVRGSFEPDLALAMFDVLWWRSAEDPASARDTDELPAGQELVFDMLADHLEHVSDFATGMTKALRAEAQEELRFAWHSHYRAMLAQALATPLRYPVKEIERKVPFVLGGRPMVTNVDLVLDSSTRLFPNGEIGVHLATRYQAPTDDELYLDDQVAAHYAAGDFSDFWIYHLRSGKVFDVDRNDRLIRSLDEMAAEDTASIEAGVFPKRFNNRRCARCPYLQTCHGV